jgi:hypothetical protein
MIDYEIQANTRRCALTGRDLKPGEKFFSVLLDEGGKFERRDYSTEAWHGAPPGAFSFWTGRIPAEGENRRPPIDDEMLLECFGRLEGAAEPDRINFRYVLALLLMRRKRLKFDETRMEGEHEILLLRCVRTGTQHRVVNPRLIEAEMSAVQEEVFKVLGWQ